MIIVTGAEQGLGKGIAEAIKSSGEEYLNLPRKILQSQDIAGETETFINSACKKYKITGAINCFGINHLSWIGSTPAKDNEIMLINTMGPYWVVNHLVNNIETGRILNISSVTYRVAQRCSTIYCASKAALVQMTKVMARELAPKGWVVNCFAPGKILETEMTRKVEEQVLKLRNWSEQEARKYEISNVPMGRFMSIDEASKIALSIYALPDYVNGEVISATGGV